MFNSKLLVSTEGGCLPQCMLGYYTTSPHASRHPLSRHPPGSRHPPRADTPQSRLLPPGSRHPPGADTHPPGADTPREQIPPEQTPLPRKQTPAYGQRAADTHPTGMHSCSSIFSMVCSFKQRSDLWFI